MKILFCANIFESSVVGPARLAENLLKINELHSEKHELYILTADAKLGYHNVYAFKYFCPKVFRFLDFWFHGRAYHKNIKKLLETHEFDAIVFGNAIYGLITKLFGINCPIIGMVNDDHVAAVNFKNYRKMPGGLGLLWLRNIEKLAILKLDFVITCSNYLTKFLEAEYHLNLQNSMVFYQGIDVFKITFKPIRFKNLNQIKVLFIKHRADIGRIEDLVLALKRLGQFNFKLTIIGPPEVAVGHVLTYAKEIFNLEINFIGPAPQSIVHQQLGQNDILCIPSSLEALGLANVEGLAHGIPVVTTNVGGIPEVMNYGQNGWLCEPGNPSSLAEALKKCITALPEEKLEKSQRGRTFVEANFNAQTLLSKFLMQLEKIVMTPNA
ncbi:MAG: glycosyltransferase [Bacteroidetes bacterium]|nr:glycosyltransferase [Bacteroidota bacterium]